MELADEQHRPALRVSALYCYPIKGCAPVSLLESAVTSAGLEHDRTFVIVDADGKACTQRRHPTLALIRPRISSEGSQLELHYAGSAPIRFATATTPERSRVDLFGVTYEGLDQGDAVAHWLSARLDQPSRLMRVPPDHQRITDGLTPGTSAFADSAPIHILSAASLTLLNSKMVDKGSPPLPMERFRPNIVIDGVETPHVEDTIWRARIGDAALGFAKSAIRCVVTTVDQALGTKTGPEPLRTLATYRRGADGGTVFGTKYAVTATGRISVGDTVIVDAYRTADI